MTVTEGPSLLEGIRDRREGLSTPEGRGEHSADRGRWGRGEPGWHMLARSVYVMDKIRNEKELLLWLKRRTLVVTAPKN